MQQAIEKQKYQFYALSKLHYQVVLNSKTIF